MFSNHTALYGQALRVFRVSTFEIERFIILNPTRGLSKCTCEVSGWRRAVADPGFSQGGAVIFAEVLLMEQSQSIVTHGKWVDPDQTRRSFEFEIQDDKN